MELTDRQREILAFIEEQLERNGMPPTRSEIVEHFGFASPNAAQCHLRALAGRGAIELRPGIARGIIPKHASRGGDRRSVAGAQLPIIGRVAAGSPILAVENRDSEIALSVELFKPRPDYALRVRGDSMTGAGIEDGDLLLVHRTPEARHGQIVVARINDEVTVKRLRRRGPALSLEPEHPGYQPIPIAAGDEFAIEGIGVGILRVGLGARRPSRLPGKP
ncbi:MAG: transcriptional repressor LexA [Pseudomonadota bacterium]|nr:MAG: transcriptional repressor LexA [Pseudomonadota bacterium]